MSDSIRLGRIAGIPVGANWSVLGAVALIFVVLTFQILPEVFRFAPMPLWPRALAGLFGASLFLVSLLGHEFAHALLARRHQVEVAGITLWLLGGVAKLMRPAPSPRAEFQIAIAGPVASFLMGLMFAGAAYGAARIGDMPLAAAIFVWLAAVNVLLAASNLLPGAPLDGGRVLTAAIWKHTGEPERARLLSARCGLVLGVGFVALGLLDVLRGGNASSWWTAFVGVFIASAARAEISISSVRHRLAIACAVSHMTPHPRAIPQSLTIGQLAVATGPAGSGIAHPVVADSDLVAGIPTLGYFASSMSEPLTAADQSWTSVGQVMIRTDAVDRIWANEPLSAAVDRHTRGIPHVLVVHDPVSGRAIGTLSGRQLEPLLTPTDFWGRDRPSTSPVAAKTAEAASGVGPHGH